ncbi:MAG TPA: acylphosphatase [Chryseosolibacter sp.]
MIKNLNIKITGHVQGVYFRASAKEKAEELNLSGFVRNEPDGGVYVEAEGEEEMLDEFVRWCRTGPPRADVTACRITPGALKNFGGFTIER